MCKASRADSSVLLDSLQKDSDLARSTDEKEAVSQRVKELEAENAKLKAAAIIRHEHRTGSSGNTPLSQQSSDFAAVLGPSTEPAQLQLAAPTLSLAADQVSSLVSTPLRYYSVQVAGKNCMQVQRACRAAAAKPDYYQVAQSESVQLPPSTEPASVKAGSHTLDFHEMEANMNKTSPVHQGQNLVFGFFCRGDPTEVAAGYERLISNAHGYFSPCRLRAAAKPFWPRAKA